MVIIAIQLFMNWEDIISYNWVYWVIMEKANLIFVALVQYFIINLTKCIIYSVMTKIILFTNSTINTTNTLDCLTICQF